MKNSWVLLLGGAMLLGAASASAGHVQKGWTSDGLFVKGDDNDGGVSTSVEVTGAKAPIRHAHVHMGAQLREGKRKAATHHVHQAARHTSHHVHQAARHTSSAKNFLKKAVEEHNAAIRHVAQATAAKNSVKKARHSQSDKLSHTDILKLRQKVKEAHILEARKEMKAEEKRLAEKKANLARAKHEAIKKARVWHISGSSLDGELAAMEKRLSIMKQANAAEASKKEKLLNLRQKVNELQKEIGVQMPLPSLVEMGNTDTQTTTAEDTDRERNIQRMLEIEHAEDKAAQTLVKNVRYQPTVNNIF
jgi:hypothetical protein